MLCFWYILDIFRLNQLGVLGRGCPANGSRFESESARPNRGGDSSPPQRAAHSKSNPLSHFSLIADLLQFHPRSICPYVPRCRGGVVAVAARRCPSDGVRCGCCRARNRSSATRRTRASERGCASSPRPSAASRPRCPGCRRTPSCPSWTPSVSPPPT